jgi:hypothetical protein
MARLGFEIPPPRRAEPEMVGLWDPPLDPPDPSAEPEA